MLESTAQYRRGRLLLPFRIIEPYAIAPWNDTVNVYIDTNSEHAVENAQSSTNDDGIEAFFTDGSVRNDLVGTGIAHRSFSFHRTIGKSADLNVYFSEVVAMYQAVTHVSASVARLSKNTRKRILIFCDSQSALQALARPHQQSGQYVLRAIWQQVHQLRTHHQISVTFDWVPAHAGVLLNEKAHNEARQATRAGSTISHPDIWTLKTAMYRHERAQLQALEQPTNRIERHQLTRHIDQALPGKHTRKIYDTLSKRDAKMLVQLRTGKSRLNTYLASIGACNSDWCECGRETESVAHFLFRCPRWQQERLQVQLTSHPRWGDCAYWLGAWSDRRDHCGELIDGARDRWRPDLDAVASMLRYVRATKRLNPEADN